MKQRRLMRRIHQTGPRRTKKRSLLHGHLGLFQCLWHLWLQWATDFITLIRATESKTLLHTNFRHQLSDKNVGLFVSF